MINDLIRIEHKLDLIIRALQTNNLMATELPSLDGIEQDTCVVCLGKISLLINPTEGELVRACSCKLPKTAYKLDVSLQPQQNKEASHADHRTEDNEVSSDR